MLHGPLDNYEGADRASLVTHAKSAVLEPVGPDYDLPRRLEAIHLCEMLFSEHQKNADRLDQSAPSLGTLGAIRARRVIDEPGMNADLIRVSQHSQYG